MKRRYVLFDSSSELDNREVGICNSKPEVYKLERLSAAQFPLVNRFYQACGYSVSCGRHETVICLRIFNGNHPAIIAAARFLPHVDGHYVLRNLCVDPQWRRKGLASYLLQNALINRGASICYCYAFDYLKDFYQAVGFIVCSTTEAPEDIACSYQRYSHKHRGLLLMAFTGCLNSPSLAP